MTESSQTTNHDLFLKHPAIDWKLSLKLADNKHDLACDLLILFIKGLPAEINSIEQAKSNLAFDQLAKNLHRLRGAASYCGVPRFLSALKALEDALRNGDFLKIEVLYEAFEVEADKLLELEVE